MLKITLLVAAVAVFAGCSTMHNTSSGTDRDGGKPTWSIAIHGGAGTISKDTPAAEVDAYYASLEAALAHGRDRLAKGDDALDVAESVVRILEDDPKFNAGRGAVFTERGTHELDASIMDGRDRSCGAVAAVRTVRHPISLARLVMTKTPHVLLASDGAEAFADTTDLERVENSWFDTESRRKALERALQQRSNPDDNAPKGTVGCVVLDSKGNLAAATSTGGMTAKRFGRVGDSPIVGAGTWADNATCAVSCTGTGEEYIRHAIAHDVHARMAYSGWSLERAASHVIKDVLKPDDGGLIAVGADGSIAMPFNTAGMFRGAADSRGRFEVGIWEEMKPRRGR